MINELTAMSVWNQALKIKEFPVTPTTLLKRISAANHSDEDLEGFLIYDLGPCLRVVWEEKKIYSIQCIQIPYKKRFRYKVQFIVSVFFYCITLFHIRIGHFLKSATVC